jgi:hypothetical protein
MNKMQLTPAQHAILAYALEHNTGKISWYPDNIKGGARQKVIDGLFKRALITYDGTDWLVAAEGYDALGRQRPAPSHLVPDPETEAAVAAVEASWASDAAKDAAKESKPRTRESSKQAEVIRMLQRPEGATIAQICEATGWQAHTVRGTFAGALKKKLGLTITSDKAQGAQRVYRVA